MDPLNLIHRFFTSSSPTDSLVLDAKIRDWVLIPIVVVMFMVAIFRHHVTKLMKTERKADLKAIKEAQILMRARKLKMNANKIPQNSFLIRKSFFNNKEIGIFREKPQDGAAPNPLANNPMMDPSNMVDMMKNNMAMIVPQIFLMSWVNYFFSGFVLVKIPFGLTMSFKTMLQRGIDLSTLDVSYVSSLSWYFLTLFGLRGLNSIFLGEANVADDTQLMQQQMQTGMGPSPADIVKVYQSERENLELTKHEYELENAEKKLMGVVGSAPTTVNKSPSAFVKRPGPKMQKTK